MKQIVLCVGALCMILIISCTKYTTLPLYTPSPTNIFSIGTLAHTSDSLNVGDTIKLNATGHIYDTTKTISVYFTATSTSPVYVFTSGTYANPVKISRTIGAMDATGTYTWSSTITLPNATITHKTALTIAANFVYQLTLSSQLGALTVADAGVKSRMVYVR